jgi:phosphoribosylformylglycinamidine synthase
VHEAIQSGLITSAHDCSEGGVLLAAVEMAFGGDLGLELHLEDESLCFSETPSRYLLEIRPGNVERLQQHFESVTCQVVGTFNDTGTVTLGSSSWKTEELFNCWMHGMVM